MEIPKHIEHYLFILAFIAGGYLVGLIFEKIILKSINKFAQKTKWKFDDVIFESLHGLIILSFMVAAFSIATHYFPVSETFRGYANKISVSVMVLVFAVLSTRILVKVITIKTTDENGGQASTSIILNIIKVIIFLIGGMLVLQVFGISVAPLLTALGVGGLAVALALQDTLTNLFSGIQVIASKKIRSGDYIRLDSGQEGFVQDITWRNSIVRTTQNNMVIVPNSKLASAIVTNYNFPETELSVPVEVGVSYDSNLQLVEKLAIETALEVMKRVEGDARVFEPFPFVRFHTFADSSINFTVTLRALDYKNQFLLKHEFIKALHVKFNENRIEIPFPIRTVYVKNQN